MHLFWCSSKANQLFLAFFEKRKGCVTLVVVEGDFIPHALPPVPVFFFNDKIAIPIPLHAPSSLSSSSSCNIIIIISSSSRPIIVIIIIIPSSSSSSRHLIIIIIITIIIAIIIILSSSLHLQLPPYLTLGGFSLRMQGSEDITRSEQRRTFDFPKGLTDVARQIHSSKYFIYISNIQICPRNVETAVWKSGEI